MKNTFKVLICVVLTIVLCSCTLCACNDNGSESYACDGEFYTLKQAYDNGWLRKSDLKSIAYHLNGTQPIGFVPKEKEPLSAEDEQSLKADYAKRYTDCPIGDILIRGYYGQYNGFVAVIVESIHMDVITEEIVGGVKFTYPDSNALILWKKH